MSDLAELETRLAARQRELDILSGQQETVTKRVEALAVEKDRLFDDVATFERSAALLNSIGEERQLKAQDTIEQLVTRGLQQIFDDSLSFHIVQKVKANAASVEFVVRTTLADGNVVETPVMEARGGGLAATIGFLLRAVILLLKGAKNEDSLLVLDETFAMVSQEYLGNLSEFLRELVDKTPIQILMVTHQAELAEDADKVYHFSMKDGKTITEEV